MICERVQGSGTPTPPKVEFWRTTIRFYLAGQKNTAAPTNMNGFSLIALRNFLEQDPTLFSIGQSRIRVCADSSFIKNRRAGDDRSILFNSCLRSDTEAQAQGTRHSLLPLFPPIPLSGPSHQTSRVHGRSHPPTPPPRDPGSLVRAKGVLHEVPGSLFCVQAWSFDLLAPCWGRSWSPLFAQPPEQEQGPMHSGTSAAELFFLRHLRSGAAAGVGCSSGCATGQSSGHVGGGCAWIFSWCPQAVLDGLGCLDRR